jgi:hypothetical protein
VFGLFVLLDFPEALVEGEFFAVLVLHLLEDDFLALGGEDAAAEWGKAYFSVCLK